MDNLLIWNVRGANDQKKHHEIKQLIHDRKAGFVSLLETKIKAKDMGKFYLSLFRGWCFTTNNVWLDIGRIIIAWNPLMFTVDIRMCISQLIDCFIKT